jgi:hypothetical protein
MNLPGSGTVDPKGVLFLFPSINDALPRDGEPVDGSEFVLAEDDWGQLEFVHFSHGKVVWDELRAICRIYDEHSHSAGFGFNNLYVRNRLIEPLAVAKLAADSLATLDLGPMRSLSFDGHEARIEGGFAHSLSSNWTVYGMLTNRHVETLAFQPALGALGAADAVALEEFARKHELLLVDWCCLAVGKPGDDVFREIVARTV